MLNVLKKNRLYIPFVVHYDSISPKSFFFLVLNTSMTALYSTACYSANTTALMKLMPSYMMFAIHRQSGIICYGRWPNHSIIRPFIPFVVEGNRSPVEIQSSISNRRVKIILPNFPNIDIKGHQAMRGITFHGVHDVC